MGISTKVSNRIKTNADGFSIGTLASIENTTSQHGHDQLLFVFQAEGTRESIHLKVWTGVAYSARKTSEKGSKVERLNKLTTLAVGLGALDESEVEHVDHYDESAIEELNAKLEACVGTEYRFKTVRNKGSKFDEVDISTVTSN